VRGGDAVKTERLDRPFRRGKLVAAIVAPLLSLGAASATAQDKPARDKKAVVRVGDGELSRCGAAPLRGETTHAKACLRGKVRAVTTEARAAREEGGVVVEGALYFVGRDTYDERGNLTLSELSDSSNGPGPVGAVFRRGVFGFDEQGRMTGSKWYEAGADEPTSAVAYTYDGRGRRVKIDSRRTKPDSHLVQEFAYDEKGREVGTTTSSLTPDGWKTSKSEKVTAVGGGLTVVRSYSADGRYGGRTEVLKDERGNILNEELYETDARGEEQLRWKVAYRYDERGFLREVVYHKADASLGSRAVYEYDGQGNCTSLTRYNADGTFAAAVRREYEYDAAGNWVAFVAFSRSSENAAPRPLNIVRRQITYY
jgi:YD repeat-containing protein